MQRRIYVLSAICALLMILALVLPFVVPSKEGGIAGAAQALLLFLGTLAVAAVFSFYLCFITARAHRTLAFGPRLAGIAPAVTLVVGLAVLLGFFRY